MLLAACAQPELGQFRLDNAADELLTLNKRTAVLDQALDLDQAVALALENNVDYALAKLERDIQYESATGETLSMLPKLNNELEYNHTNQRRISSSENAGPSSAPCISSSPREDARSALSLAGDAARTSALTRGCCR